MHWIRSYRIGNSEANYKMKNIKIIAIDVDGTLLNSKKELNLKVKNTILKENSGRIKIVITTGRPMREVEKILNELSLEDQKNQYVVCFGGRVVETTAGYFLFEKKLTYDN